MFVTALEADGFRNLREAKLSPCSEMNVICGENGQGKTNLLEAIYFFTGMKSFRGSGVRDAQLLCFGGDRAALSLCCDDGRRVSCWEGQLVHKDGGVERRVSCNGVDLKKLGAEASPLRCVVFAPSHLSLVKDGPEQRRRFLDQAISQVKGVYADYLSQYQRTLYQRNALLKRTGHVQADLLDVWDLQLAKAGTVLSIFRCDYVRKLSAVARDFYTGISGGREDFTVSYRSTVFHRDMSRETYTDENIGVYYDSLRAARADDVEQGFTSVGVHRDDLECSLDGTPMRLYASQGQQRSAVLALKLSESRLFEQLSGQRPVVLLDDVMSELDVKRQDYVLNSLGGVQVFVTCCDPSSILRLKKGAVYEVSAGCVRALDV